jgi:hypothetical protein
VVARDAFYRKLRRVFGEAQRRLCATFALSRHRRQHPCTCQRRSSRSFEPNVAGGRLRTAILHARQIPIRSFLLKSSPAAALDPFHWITSALSFREGGRMTLRRHARPKPPPTRVLGQLSAPPAANSKIHSLQVTAAIAVSCDLGLRTPLLLTPQTAGRHNRMSSFECSEERHDSRARVHRMPTT